MRANAAISPLIFKGRIIFFWKSSHAPSPAKIIKIEKKKNEISVVVGACSDTEATSVSTVIKKGFAALRYLNVGRLISPEEAIAIPAIIAPTKSARLLRNWALLVVFLITTHATRNVVQPIRKNPLRLEINIKPVFSNDMVTKRNTDVKITEAHMMNLLSFLRNGNTRKKSPIGNMKNWMPPHEVRPKASKIPAPTIFAADIFPLSDFIPLISR
jgi:hypothetical protein